LTVQFAPLIVAGPSNVTVKLGQPAKFTVDTLGVNVKTNPFVCQWYVDGAPLHEGHQPQSHAAWRPTGPTTATTLS
jgi:hypothetical protein